MTISLLIAALIGGQNLIAVGRNADEPKHLFILSGQSNMAGLRPEESFTPAVEQAFGKKNVIVVKDAQGGQPIRRWYKSWDAIGKRTAAAQDQQANPPGKQKAGKTNRKNQKAAGKNPKPPGDLYDRLMEKVKTAVGDQQVDTVTLVWMQGERDAREQNGDVYATCLAGLREQIGKDLGKDQVHFVIGRLSDFDMDNKPYRDWTKIRQIQVEFADNDPLAEWVDTDDLNDGTNRRGKKINNDLHYSATGYQTLGSRFAEKAIQLIEKQR